MKAPNPRHLSYLALAVLMVFIALTFRQYGISNDEEVQHTYGRLLLQFYASGFADQSAFHYRNLYLYGGFFDLLAAAIERLFGIAEDSPWLWDMRHLLSALFGFWGILAAYRMARFFGGERAGLLAIVLLSLTGAWSGAMFTHTKDVPFAACMAWATYYLILLAQALPAPRLSLSVRFGLATGLAFGLRVGAAFVVLYALIALLHAALARASGLRDRLRFIGRSVLALLPAGLTALLLMAFFWPWGVMAPDHPLEAVRAFSHFTFDMLTVMDGAAMQIGAVPRDYLLAYLLVRLPEIFLLGLAIALGLALAGWRQLRWRDAQAWLVLLLAALFPLAFAVWDRPALYNGIRHFTFVLPPLAVLAAWGLSTRWQQLRSRPRRRNALALLVLVLALDTLVTLARLHPYQYVYYNHLAGSLKQAETRWEGDYWSSSVRAAALMLDQYVSRNEPARAALYLVAVCAESLQADVFLDRRFRITSDWEAADFYISSTNMHCDRVMQGRVIARIERMGAVLAVVKDRRGLMRHQRHPRSAPN